MFPGEKDLIRFPLHGGWFGVIMLDAECVTMEPYGTQHLDRRSCSRTCRKCRLPSDAVDVGVAGRNRVGNKRP